jgi:hypothetical protein
MTTLGALLLNPALTEGKRTLRHLGVAADLLDCNALAIANLFSIATRNATAINEAGRSEDGWNAARPQLRQIVAESDQLLAGWGISGLAGRAAKYRQLQLEYVCTCAQEFGKDCVWTLNGEPRHPSRWHQYVSDRHGRASGTSFGERMTAVLKSVPLATLCPKYGSGKSQR